MQSSPFSAVVLAGGAGARFGGAKLLAPYGGGVLLDAALAAAFDAPVDQVIVVTGAEAARVEAAAHAFAGRAGETGRLRIAHAPDHAEGLAASLRAGLEAVAETSEAAFVFLGDMPRIPQGLPARLAEALGGRFAAAPVFEGRRGHPVLVARALFPVLEALDGDRGAAGLLEGLGEGLARVATDDAGVLFDVDRPEDLAGK